MEEEDNKKVKHTENEQIHWKGCHIGGDSVVLLAFVKYPYNDLSIYIKDCQHDAV